MSVGGSNKPAGIAAGYELRGPVKEPFDVENWRRLTPVLAHQTYCLACADAAPPKAVDESEVHRRAAISPPPFDNGRTENGPDQAPFSLHLQAICPIFCPNYGA